MKMSQESYSNMVSVFTQHAGKIKEYAPKLKASGKYKDFERRLAWDCLNAFIGSAAICDTYYNKEGLNDDHITTAGKKALKQTGIL